MNDNKYKKIFSRRFLLGLMVMLFASCGEENDIREPEYPVDNSVFTLSVGQDYILGTTISIAGPIDSTIVSWEPVNSPLVRIFEDTLFIVPGMENGENGEVIEILNVSTVAKVKAINTGSESLTVTVSYLKNGEWRSSRAIPRQVTIQKHNSNATDDEGVTINGIKWATRNVGISGSFVAKPEDAGLYYRWNSKVDWDGSYFSLNTITPWSASRDSSLYPLAWEDINDPCPKGWRMPTQEELQSLFSVGKKWQSRTGINGCWFFEGDNLLFLPAAGYRYERDGKVYLEGVNGAYWSNTAIGASTAFALSVADTESGRPQNSRDDVGVEYGLSCRCVKAE